MDNQATKSFQIMIKPVGPICNLDCKYCFYLEKEKLYPDETRWAMQTDVLESFIRQRIESDPAEAILFSWQGGEPTLLGVNYFRKVVEIQKKFAVNKRIENTFQTNGVLLNDEWCEFFNENKFLIGLSIDGPKELHDTYRVNKKGESSFDKVVNGIAYLKKHSVEFNTLTCIHRSNSYHPLEVYNFLREIGSGYMQFIPIVERQVNSNSNSHLDNSSVSEWSVEPEQYGKFLNTVFDEWVRKDVGKYFVQIFDVALESWMNMNPSLCIFRKTCGDALAIEHNGDLFSCDHFVYPQNMLGNIMENPLASLVNSSQQKKFGQDKNDKLPQYCLNCNVRFACNGECPKHRFIKTPDGEDGLNYLCAGYKLFFNHIDVFMKFMSNELKNKRPPANIMKWVKDKDKGFPALAPLRNDSCPCGSGKKYKNCCMM